MKYGNKKNHYINLCIKGDVCTYDIYLYTCYSVVLIYILRLISLYEYFIYGYK